MAWKKLEKRWDPKSREDKIDLTLNEVSQVKNGKYLDETQDWLAHLEKKQNELNQIMKPS